MQFKTLPAGDKAQCTKLLTTKCEDQIYVFQSPHKCQVHMVALRYPALEGGDGITILSYINYMLSGLSKLACPCEIWVPVRYSAFMNTVENKEGTSYDNP